MLDSIFAVKVNCFWFGSKGENDVWNAVDNNGKDAGYLVCGVRKDVSKPAGWLVCLVVACRMRWLVRLLAIAVQVRLAWPLLQLQVTLQSRPRNNPALGFNLLVDLDPTMQLFDGTYQQAAPIPSFLSHAFSLLGGGTPVHNGTVSLQPKSSTSDEPTVAPLSKLFSHCICVMSSVGTATPSIPKIRRPCHCSCQPRNGSVGVCSSPLVGFQPKLSANYCPIANALNLMLCQYHMHCKRTSPGTVSNNLI